MTDVVRGRRHISFVWRIAISFVVFVVVVLIGQGVMFSYLRARSNDPFGPGNPTATAAALAATLGQEVSRNPAFDTGAFLRARDLARPLYVVTRDERVWASREPALAPAIRRQMVAMLAGRIPAAGDGDAATGPVVTAPVQVDGLLQALVVLPPPPPRGVFADAAELLSLPGTLVLIGASIVAAVVIFAPARRRLRALEIATERFGRGELDARAPEGGQDEIARVAAAFNRMAADLAARSEALRVSDKLRRQMLADVSHELRTPLTSMVGYLDTLEMAELSLDPETRARYLETVRSETHRLRRIVDDLLDLARHENRAAPLDVRVFDIGRVFHHVTRRHERDAAAAGVDLRTSIDAGAEQVVGDPDRLEQVIGNLVANALRHTPRGGVIELCASAGPEAYTLSVIDSGSGIAAEHLPHVFDRFYKADAGRVATGGGSGLGLSIAKAIVERHGGTIAVTSVPGRTAFIVTLPAA